jgi:hypothetical protein
MTQVLAIVTFIAYGFRILFVYLADKVELTKPFIVIGHTLFPIMKPLYYLISNW